MSDGWEAAPATVSEDGWETAPTASTSLMDDFKIGMAQVGNMADKAWTLAASNLASEKEAEDMFRNMEAREKSRNEFAGNKKQGTGGKLTSALTTLPMQVVAAPLSAVETAMEFIRNGESLEKAYKAAGVDAAFTAAGFALPAGIGKTVLQKALTGGAAGAVQEVASKYFISNMADQKQTKEQFAPSVDDAVVGGVIGAGFGAAMPRRVDTPTDLNTKLEPTITNDGWESASTMAAADDFAAMNPYDVGGHVTAAQAGSPAMIDSAQPDLFGGQVLEQAQPQPRGVMADERVYGNEILYEPISLGGEPAAPKPELQMPMVPDRLALESLNSEHYNPRGPWVPKEDMLEFEWGLDRQEAAVPPAALQMPGMEMPPKMSLEDTTVPLMNTVRMHKAAIKEAQQSMLAREEENIAMFEAMKKAEREQAFKQVEQESQIRKDAHYQQLEQLKIAERAGEIDFQHARDVVRDGNLMDEGSTRAMTEAARTGDIASVMNTIRTNHPNVLYRELAQFLSDKTNGIKINVSPEEIINFGDRQITGYFDAVTNTVHLSGLGATSPHTVMHEVIHALTSTYINGRPNDLRVKALTGLYDRVRNTRGFQKFEGIVNSREFIAEAFSNPEFQKFLKNIKVDNRSVWNRFVDGVKRLLGLNPNVRNSVSNALEHSLDLGKQIIEASDANTRKSIRDEMLASGIPTKLADAMATKPKDIQPTNDVSKLKIPGLKHAVSDFAFYTESIPEIIEMAKQAPDIPDTTLEHLSHQLQAGGLFESLKTRNPVVKFTYERITRATEEAALNIRKYLTDHDTGLKTFMRALSPSEKGEINAFMMQNEGVREVSSMELARRGFNEKEIAYYNKYREVSDEFFNMINQRRAELGMRPMDKRIAHIAGRFMGDFSRFVKSADGTKIVGRISGNTKWELDRISKFIKAEHPDWQLGDVEYNKIHRDRSPADRFEGLMEALNFVAKEDADTNALLESYKAYAQQDVINYLNATRHAKAKVRDAGGIIGSEGHKPWLDAVKNAEEGMKAQLAYFEQGYKWMAMEKAVKDITQVIGNEEVALNQQRAVKWAEMYKDHALGRNQGPLSNAANWTASKLGEFLGTGHSNFFKASNLAKDLYMKKFMGFMNIPFTLTQLMQPIQTHPAMITLLKTRGLEFSARQAQVKAMNTYLNALTEEKTGKMSSFEREAMKYADEMGILDVKMTDHMRDINAGPIRENFLKMADLNITVPERFTRGTSFLFYSHLLKDAGIPAKDIFGAAENLTNFTMVNYHPIERPMGYAKLGWIGDVASTLTRYKHNQWSQLAFYTREGVRNDTGAGYKPLAAMLATSLAFGGVMGFFGFQEADALYQEFTENALKKPDTLTNVMLQTPELLSHGVWSQLGLDMTTRFSNANVIPDSLGKAVMPYGTAILDNVETTGRWMIDPTSPTKAKQMVKSLAPSSMQGLLENQLFTEGDLYTNPTYGPNMGTGRVERTENEKGMRNLGFRSIRESRELAKNFSDSQIQKGNKNLAESNMNKVKVAILDGTITPEKLSEFGRKAAGYGMGPDQFVNEIVTWSRDRQLTQQEQIRLRNALAGYRGAFNISEGR
jgi:hypothetical protein